MKQKFLKYFLMLLIVALSTMLLSTGAMATEEVPFDKENFKGLVLTTSVGSGMGTAL